MQCKAIASRELSLRNLPFTLYASEYECSAGWLLGRGAAKNAAGRRQGRLGQRDVCSRWQHLQGTRTMNALIGVHLVQILI